MWEAESMDVKEKSVKKIPKRAILVAVMALLVGCVAVVTLLSAFQKGTFQSQFSEDEIRAYLASDDSKSNGVTPEAADLWLQEFLGSEEKGSVEINRTLKIQKGYTVNGTKTINGEGTFLAEENSGGNILSVSENSSLFVEGINADCNYNMNVGVNVKTGASLSWKGGSILRAMDYGVFSSGDVKVEDSSIQDCGVWMEIRSGSKANAKNTEFYKCGSGGIVVAKDAECHITGEKTLIEQSGKEAIKNEGTFTMTDGNIYMTNGYGIDNFGTATLTGVKQNRSVLGGLVLNEIGATATVKDCVLWNNIYHVRNYGELNLEDSELNTATGSSILNEPEGTLNIKSVSVVNGNNYAIYNRNGIANVKDLECELILNTGIVNIGDGTIKIDGYSIDRCQMAIENRASEENGGFGEIYANDVTVKNAGNRNIFSWGGVCNISNSTLYPSQGYSVYIRGGSAVLDSVKILGTIKETSGGLAVGSTIYKDPVVTIKGNTEITGCASRGIINYNKLTIYDCNIHDNNTSGKLTSGVGIYSVGDVYMHGGKIHDNYGTKYGAGIRLDRNDKAGLIGNLYMYGGSIYDNEAGISGGGVSVAEKCVFEMRGGSIYNNRGVVRGDGMVISGTFNLYDAERIGENDIYLTEGNKINVKSNKLSFDFAKLSLASYAKTVKEVVVFPSDEVAKQYYSKFSTKNQQFAIAHSKNAGILVHSKTDFDTTYDFSKAQVVTVTTFEQLKKEVENTKQDESKVIVIAADIVMTDKITLPPRTDIKLTDNGVAHKLVRGTEKNLFDVGRMSHLVLGGAAGITIDGDSLNGKVVKTSLVCVSNFGYFVLEDGATLQNAANNGTSSSSGVRGAAVNVAMDGSFIMRGGVITNCSSPKDDKYSDKYCAVYNSSSGGVSIKGGTISNCNDRAILSLNNVFMSGGTIENCQQALSGGGAVRTPMFVMTGGTIQNCLSTNAGSAVYLTTNTGSYAQGYFELDGGTITGNKNGTTLSTSTFGGAVYIDKTSTFDFKSGKISDNVAGDKEYRMACAGILNDGVVNIGKDAVITGNVSMLSTGAIYNRASGTMTITGATITDNTSTNVRWVKDNSRYGSAAAINNEGTLILDGVKVTDNNVGTYGTVYSSNGNVTIKDMTFTGNESGANGTITDDYGNKLAQNNKGVDVTIAKDTNTVTLAGKIVATETESAFRLNLDKTFKLANDFSTDSKINLYLHDNIYVGRQVLKGNVTSETVTCFTWTNPKEGYYLADDGYIRANKTEAVIGETTYVTLEEAVAAAKDGDIIELLCDVSLAKQLKINKAITITTDGEADRTIYAESSAAGSNIIVVNAPDKNVVLKGASEESQLILDGDKDNVTLKGAFIRVENADNQKVTMEYLTIQNIVSESGWGTAVSAVKPFEAKHCTFIECGSTNSENLGGAIYTSAGAAGTKIIDCQFEGCTSNSQGGAIYTKGEITVEDSQFVGCKAEYRGGAIYTTVELTITGSQFTGCRAENRGGAIYSEKGMTLTECTFGDGSVNGGNTAGNAGGAICVKNKNVLDIIDSTFTGNKAEGDFGGAVAMSTDTSTVNLIGNVTFDGNTTGTTRYGGGAIMTGSVLNIAENANVTIKDSETKGLGGGIYFNATNTPEFTLGEGAVLTMTGNKDKNGTVDIAIKNGGKPAEFNLNGTFDLDGIATTAGTKITLGEHASDSDLENFTTVVLHANDSGTAAQEGDQLVYGSNVADTIFKVSGDTYKLDASGYLAVKNPKVELRQNGSTRQYATIEIALSEAQSGDEIALIDNFTLDGKVTIDKSVTITTDGEADRIIYCGAGAALDNVIEIVGEDIEVTFKGSKDSKLVFDGNTVTLSKTFICAETGNANKLTMEYVKMQNITSTGSGAAVRSYVPLDINQCTFSNCTSGSNGGAIHTNVAGKEVSIKNSVFAGNSSSGNGGAIYIEQTREKAITINNCTFENNTSSGNGGAIRVSSVNTLNITGSTFVGNMSTGNFGGAVAMGSGSSTLNLSGTCVFHGNTAKGTSSYKGGGAIFVPVNFNIKEGAWVEIFGNECTGYASGDAICVNTDAVSKAKFVVETGAALYVYNNPSKADTDNDVCIKDGTALTPTVNGVYEVWEPVAKVGNVGYETLQSAIGAVESGGEIALVHDVTLNAQLTISKSVTITTDGKANRTIYCGAGVASDSVIVVNESDKVVTFKGASKESQLVFDGNSDTVTLSKYFIYPGTKDVHAKKVVMQYVTMQNVKSSSKYGSAICSYSPMEVQNCTFVECESTDTDAAGGAIYLGSTSAGTEFTNCQFKKCTTAGRGGAIYSENGMDIINCTFGDENDIANAGNTATKAGGAICVGNENVLNIESSKFYGNKSNSQFGGAVAMRTGTSTVSLSGKVVFESNTAKGGGYGGGAIMTGKALIVAADANVTIKNNTTEDLGGGIYFNAGAAPTFTLGNGAALTMSGNTDKNGSVNIAVKAGMLQAGSQFIIGNNVTDRISSVNVGDVTYSIDAEGKLMAINQ